MQWSQNVSVIGAVFTHIALALIDCDIKEIHTKITELDEKGVVPFWTRKCPENVSFWGDQNVINLLWHALAWSNPVHFCKK